MLIIVQWAQQVQGGNINDMMQARMCQNEKSQNLPKFNNFVASQRYIPFQRNTQIQETVSNNNINFIETYFNIWIYVLFKSVCDIFEVYLWLHW